MYRESILTLTNCNTVRTRMSPGILVASAQNCKALANQKSIKKNTSLVKKLGYLKTKDVQQ